MRAAIEGYFIYFPERELLGTPADLGLEFENLEYRGADGVRLHGWLVPGRGEPALLWFHGNAGNISHRLDQLQDLHRELDVPVLIHEYRGYGASAGRPSEEGLYLDAQAALDALTARLGIPAERVVLFGQSLGAAVAVELATHRHPAAVVVESAFTSVREMARYHYGWLPVRPLLQTRFDSLAKIAGVGAPVLVIHGERDEIAPMEMGTSLHATAREPKRLVLLPSAGHNDAYLVGRDQYFGAFRELLATS